MKFNFNSILRTTLTEEYNINFFKEEFNKKLKKYIKGTAEKPSSGYQKIDLVIDKKDEELEKIKHQLISYSHIREDYSSEGIENRSTGESIREGVKREIKTTDFYWCYPDFIAIRGSFNDAQYTAEILENLLKEYHIKTEPIKFESEFLVWLMYKFRKKEELIKNFGIDLLGNMKTFGDIDVLGMETSVKQSLNVSKAPQIILTILSGKTPKGLRGSFHLNDFAVTADIETMGKTKILVKGTLKTEKDEGTRIGVSLFFIKKLIETYDYWEKLSNDEKYPPTDFFIELKDDYLKQTDKILTSNLVRTIEHFENLRR